MKTKTLFEKPDKIFLSQKGNVIQEPEEFSQEYYLHLKVFIVSEICLYFCVTSDSVYNKQIMIWQDPDIFFIHLFWYSFRSLARRLARSRCDTKSRE